MIEGRRICRLPTGKRKRLELQSMKKFVTPDSVADATPSFGFVSMNASV
jgi:hypothetical protein